MEYILVTGACGGIGEAVTKQLLAQGFGVWAVDRDAERLQAMLGSTQNVKTKVCAFENENATKDLVKAIVEETGPLRGLVHCAGISNFSMLHMLKQSVMEKVFNIHVFTAMTLCSLLAKKGNACDSCSVVFLSSIACHEGSEGNSIYASAKAAVEGFVTSAAEGFIKRGIRLNVVVLGDVATGMFKKFYDSLPADKQQQRQSTYPLGFGTVDDVASMICHLLSDKARWITGQKFVLDGGHSVRGV